MQISNESRWGLNPLTFSFNFISEQFGDDDNDESDFKKNNGEW